MRKFGMEVETSAYSKTTSWRHFYRFNGKPNKPKYENLLSRLATFIPLKQIGIKLSHYKENLKGQKHRTIFVSMEICGKEFYRNWTDIDILEFDKYWICRANKHPIKILISLNIRINLHSLGICVIFNNDFTLNILLKYFRRTHNVDEITTAISRNANGLNSE